MASSATSSPAPASLGLGLGLGRGLLIADEEPASAPLPGLMRLRCAVQHYDWGRRGADSLVARLAGDGDPASDDRPCAELWMGTHPAAPSSLAPDVSLRDWVARNPAALGRAVAARWAGDLPFLFKVPYPRALRLVSVPPTLAISESHAKIRNFESHAKMFPISHRAQVLSVAKALSIQAHPDRDLARALHALRPAAYRDANHKPEMAVAITEFRALCGFAGTLVRTSPVPRAFLRAFHFLRSVEGGLTWPIGAPSADAGW